jgi:hypothetical protein
VPLQKLQFKPGLNKDQTNYSNEGGFFACDKIRFRSGYPQKLGGWLRYGVFELLGICRQMFTWITASSDNNQAIGTNLKLYVEAGANLYDITPLRATIGTPATDNCFETTNGSNIVTVNITAFGSSTGDYVTFAGSTAVGGIPATELNANHSITKIDSGSFTITVTTNANSNVAAGGGTAIIAYFEIPVGPATTTYGYGWSAGVWSRGGWGSGSTAPLTIFQRDWFFDNFDSDLVANIRNGAPYYWAANPLYNSRAVLLSSLVDASDVPTQVTQLLVSQGDKHLLAFGATPFGGGAFDPLLIRWASQNYPQIWDPTVTDPEGDLSTAGFLRVSRGSRIIRAIPTRQEIIVFTDATLNSLQFLGTTDVFGIQELSDNISIASPRACIAVNNTVYWMGIDKFYVYSGSVSTLPTTLRNHVFQNINFNQLDQIISGTNEGWNEVWWFYPTANSTVNNAYVVYNYLERIWFYGSIERTAWNDSSIRKYPQAVGGSFVYNHEDGVNDDVLPMAAYIQTSDFDIADGEQFLLTKRILPDIDFSGSTAANPTVNMTIKPRNFPGSAYATSPSQPVIQTTVDQYTDQIFLRARARQMGITISSEDLGVNWQLGSPRLDGKLDGKR